MRKRINQTITVTVNGTEGNRTLFSAAFNQQIQTDLRGCYKFGGLNNHNKRDVTQERKIVFMNIQIVNSRARDDTNIRQILFVNFFIRKNFNLPKIRNV